ncbi:MAG TPA: hypothetical protein VFT19_11225 [Solirubrobacterales bacterium]|nr:hypothetical protein [Solirubrobacterales bacterium]
MERSDPPPEAKPVDALDVEAAMLLVAPLLRLDEDLSGDRRLARALVAEFSNALFDEAAYAH